MSNNTSSGANVAPLTLTIDAGIRAKVRERIASEIRSKVRMVVRNESNFGVLSTGEKIAVALVLDRADLWAFWGTALAAADRLGHEWLEAALQVQRDGWD